jgi:DNA-binding response OmpR family regulator
MQTVLIVDPTLDVREAVMAAVDPSKIRLQWADAETDATGILRRHTVTSVVVSIDNRTTEKLAFIDLVRRGRRTHYAHIIAVSACKNGNLLNDALVAGADDYMSRPIHPDEFLRRFHWAASMSRLDRKRPFVSMLDG